MLKTNAILTLLLFSSVFSQYDYNLEDLNSTSQFYGQEIGTSYFPGKVSVHYFGHYNWGLCSSRFGQLNSLFESWIEEDLPVQLVGVGKNSHLSYLGNWASEEEAQLKERIDTSLEMIKSFIVAGASQTMSLYNGK